MECLWWRGIWMNMKLIWKERGRRKPTQRCIFQNMQYTHRYAHARRLLKEGSVFSKLGSRMGKRMAKTMYYIVCVILEGNDNLYCCLICWMSEDLSSNQSIFIISWSRIKLQLQCILVLESLSAWWDHSLMHTMVSIVTESHCQARQDCILRVLMKYECTIHKCKCRLYECV